MSNIIFNANILSKDTLKTLFINNYNNSYGVPSSSPYPGLSLHNNKGFQCFRNAAFYMVNRMQSELWNGIDRLPVLPTSDKDKNQYLIIQTFVEMMDDRIINSLYSSGTIEFKRTEFIDERFKQLLNVTDSSKYISYGVQEPKYETARNNELLTFMSMADLRANGMLNKGGNSQDVLVEFLVNQVYFNSTSLSGFPAGQITGTTDYIKISLSEPVDNFIKKYITYKTITNNLNEPYRLVGILYDCPYSTTHSITSVCFGDHCDLDDPTHIFMDDDLKIKKNLGPSFNRNGLQWSCGDAGKSMNVGFLLYEKKSVRARLQKQIQDFIDANNIVRSSPFVVVGGGNKDYFTLYQKYKNKYLQLKNK